MFRLVSPTTNIDELLIMNANNYYKLLWVVFLFAFTQVWGQDDWQFATHSNNITGISVNEEEVWVSTRDGIFKFNSLTEESIKFSAVSTNMTDDFMTGILVTPDDSIWVAYYYFGAGHAGADADTWVNYQVENSPLGSNFVRTMAVAPSGAVYLGTFYGGISIYEHGEWSALKDSLPISNSSGGIIQIAFDPNSHDDTDAWFGTKKHGLYHRRLDSTWVFYDIYNSDLPGNIVSGLAIDQRSRVWAGSHDGFAILDDDEMSVFSRTNSPLLSNYIHDIAIDRDSIAWLATEHGLVRIPTNSFEDLATWTVFTKENSGLSSDWIEKVVADTSTGNLWIGTYSKGLIRYDGTNWETFKFNDDAILDNDVLSLNFSERDSTLMVSTRTSGLGLLQDSVWTIIDKEHNGLPTDQVNFAAKDTFGNVWIAYSFDGLTKWDGTTATHYNPDNSPLKPPYNVIHDIYIDPSNVIWLAVNGGLWEFEIGTDTWTFHNADLTGKYANVEAIEPDGQGGFWYGGSKISLMHFDGTSLTGYNTPDSLLNKIQVTDLETDPWGNVWIGTFGHGLLRKDSDDHWYLYNGSNSVMKGNLVSSLQYTPDSTLWVGTTGAGLYSYKLGPWNHFGVYSGHLPQNNVADLVWDNRNTLWIGMPNMGLGHHFVPIYTPPQDSLFKDTTVVQDIMPFSGKINIYPNPANDVVHLDLDVPRSGSVLLSIFDSKGRLLKEYIPGFLPSGQSIIDVDVSDLPSGYYYLQLFLNGERGGKMLQIR